jgi:putative flippase GtrA
MLTFLRAQTASLVASAVDFAVTIAGVEFAGLWYGGASVLGNITGAVVHFMMGRRWVFSATGASLLHQSWKYGIVWTGYVTLNFLLLVATTTHAGINYGLAKVVVAIALSVSYNYVLQKKFVFK